MYDIENVTSRLREDLVQVEIQLKVRSLSVLRGTRLIFEKYSVQVMLLHFNQF